MQLRTVARRALAAAAGSVINSDASSNVDGCQKTERDTNFPPAPNLTHSPRCTVDIPNKVGICISRKPYTALARTNSQLTGDEMPTRRQSSRQENSTCTPSRSVK